MAENVGKYKSRRDLTAYSHVSEKVGQYKALPEKVEDSCDDKDSKSDCRSSKHSRNQFTRCPEMESNKVTIHKDDFEANQFVRRSRSPKWSGEEVCNEEGFMSSWEPMSGSRTVSKDGNVERHTDGWGMALDQSGPDGGKQRDCSTSPNGAWNRSRRSRSRSPSYGGKGGSDFWDKRGRMGERSAVTCREFAAGRCRRGSQCRYLHEDSGRRHADRHYGSNTTEIKEGRSARGWYLERTSKGDIRESWDQGDYSRDILFQKHGGHSSGEKKHELHRNRRSTGPCYDFLKGRCHRGSACRYPHDDASSGGGSLKDDSREMTNDRRGTDESFGRRFEPCRTSDVPCKYFAEGRCRRGEDCRFFHEGVAHGRVGTGNCSSWDSPKWDDKTATTWQGPKWGEKISTSNGPQGSEKTATSWDAPKSGEKTASSWDGLKLGEKTTTSLDGPKWGEKTITSLDGPKWGEKTTTSWSGPSWGDETPRKDVPDSSRQMYHSDCARDAATDSTDIDDCMHKAQHLPSHSPGDDNKIILQGALRTTLPSQEQNTSKEVLGLQDLVTVSTTMPESSHFQQHSGLSTQVLKNEQRDASGAGIQIDLNLSADNLSAVNADPILNTSQSQQKGHLASQPSHASHLTQSVQNQLDVPAVPSNGQIQPLMVCSLPVNAQSQTIVVQSLSKTLSFSLSEQIQQIASLEGSNQQPAILNEQNRHNLPQTPYDEQNKQNSNFCRQHLQTVCVPAPHNNRQSHSLASDGMNQDSGSLLQSDPSFSSDDQNQKSIAQFQSNSTCHVETGGEKSISDSELSEKHPCQLSSICQTCQEATTEQMKSATVSASFVQILENSPQLPQLHATYKCPTSTEPVTSKPNFNPSAVKPLSPSALPYVLPNQESWSLKHCGPVSDDTNRAASDASNLPSSVVSVEKKHPAMEKSQINPDSFLPLSVIIGPINGSGNLKKSANLEHKLHHGNQESVIIGPINGSGNPKKSANLEQKLHHGNQEAEQIVPSRSTTKEEKETDTGQDKTEQRLAHSGKVEIYVHTDGENNRSKDEKELRMFKFALVEFVKDILKPTWKEGRLSKEAHKTIVKKVVEKVTSTLQGSNIPQTQEKIDLYLSHSKTKLIKLVQAYVEKHVKS